MKTLKRIGWSYPSSPNAKRFGFDRTGCYAVCTVEIPNGLPKYLAGFETYQKAETFANTLTNDWSKLSVRRPDGSHPLPELCLA